MAKAGTKRASPGAEEEKNPLQGVELSEEDAKRLHAIAKDITREELILGLFLCALTLSYIDKVLFIFRA